MNKELRFYIGRAIKHALEEKAITIEELEKEDPSFKEIFEETYPGIQESLWWQKHMEKKSFEEVDWDRVKNTQPFYGKFVRPISWMRTNLLITRDRLWPAI